MKLRNWFFGMSNSLYLNSLFQEFGWLMNNGLPPVVFRRRETNGNSKRKFVCVRRLRSTRILRYVGFAHLLFSISTLGRTSKIIPPLWYEGLRGSWNPP